MHEFREHIRFVACRQEGGAANMAEAYGKLTGRPGICFVTRGPGATNASIGVHTAFQDSTPMILFVGQVARDQVEREAFQDGSDEHTSELQSLMRMSYAVFCLKKNTTSHHICRIQNSKTQIK